MKLKTKFILTYVAGIVTGCIVFFVISCIIVANNSSKDDVVDDSAVSVPRVAL
jgi:mannitol-specific phosphotransferase system IIBC component